MKASKTEKRNILLNTIMNVISDKDIYDEIGFKKSEDKIKQHMYQPLKAKINEHFINQGVSVKTAKNKTLKSLKWESHNKQTMHNMVLFGTQHRPDMEVCLDGIKIAIEVKKGDKGSDVRAGFGQCLVYSTAYDFIIYLFVDTSKDKRIKNSIESKKEKFVIDSLWENHNSLIKVV